MPHREMDFEEFMRLMQHPPTLYPQNQDVGDCYQDYKDTMDRERNAYVYLRSKGIEV
jgi:hypothetical protein